MHSIEEIQEMNKAGIEVIYRDKNGKRIEAGDILKVFHFIGSRNRHHFMYKVAVEKNGELVGMDIKELAMLGFDKAHTYRLASCSLEGTEILEK